MKRLLKFPAEKWTLEGYIFGLVAKKQESGLLGS